MALPSSGTLSMTQIAAELGISKTGLRLGDSRVRALAGKSSGRIAYSDLRGKSAGMRFRFTVGYASKVAGNSTRQTTGYGYQDSSQSIDNIGTAVDVVENLRAKNGSTYAMKLYVCMPEKFITQSGGGGGGFPPPRDARQLASTNYQFTRFSVLRNDGGSTAGSAFDFGRCEIKLKSGNTVLASTTKTNPVNGQGTGSSAINLLIQGSTPDSSNGIAETFWKAFYNQRNKQVTLEMVFK